MKPSSKIRAVSSAVMLLAFSGWGMSHTVPVHAAPASEGPRAAVGEIRDAGDRAAPEGSIADARAASREADREAGREAGHEAGHPHRLRRLSPEAKPILDRSGRTRVGKASFYARMFAGRTMADGTRMEPSGDNAASRTLPLGTTAKVTNLETGKTAVVTIRDRGPYIAGRIVDLSPATARQIGLDKRTGVTQVKVAPIVVPLADGQIKLGDGVLQASNSPQSSGSLDAGD